MKRRHLAAVVVAVIGLTLLSPATAEARHGDRYKCNYHPAKGTWHRRMLMRCEYDRINPPGSWGYVLGIARCESGPDFIDARGGAHDGPFQQLVSRFADRMRFFRKKWDRALRDVAFHFRSNVIVSMRQAKNLGTWATQWACA